MGNSALGLTFNLKPVAVVQAQQQKEAVKEGNAGTDAEKAKARENQETSRKALMDSYGAGKEAAGRRRSTTRPSRT